jgi:RNA-directed DNA polymerase
MTGNAFAMAMAMAALEVNGPEDGLLHWDAIRWCSVEKDVQRLRRRIFAATWAGDYKRVRSLQKLMLHSQSNTLVSVRQVGLL